MVSSLFSIKQISRFNNMVKKLFDIIHSFCLEFTLGLGCFSGLQACFDLNCHHLQMHMCTCTCMYICIYMYVHVLFIVVIINHSLSVIIRLKLDKNGTTYKKSNLYMHYIGTCTCVYKIKWCFFHILVNAAYIKVWESLKMTWIFLTVALGQLLMSSLSLSLVCLPFLSCNYIYTHIPQWSPGVVLPFCQGNSLCFKLFDDSHPLYSKCPKGSLYNL